jgi:hypothetical protein
MIAANESSSGSELLLTAQKLRGTTDGRPVFVWLRGISFTHSEGEVLPLYRYVSVAITRSGPISGDGYPFTLYEIGFYTDYETGKVLDSLTIPLTGRKVSVPRYRTGPGHHVAKAQNTEALEWRRARQSDPATAAQLAPDSTVTYKSRLFSPWNKGDQLWLRAESFTRMQPYDPSSAGIFYKESIIYKGSVSELADPRVTSANVGISFALANSWRPWMDLDGVPGHAMTDGIGGKVMDWEALPTDLLGHIAEYHPDITDPVALLDQTSPTTAE